MKFLKVDNCDTILDFDPKCLQMNICDYIVFLRSKNLASQSIAAYVAAIRKFLDMNDVIALNWKKIHSFEPEAEQRNEDRPYTNVEIATLLSKSSPRDRAIILLMASSGVRVGAIAYPLLLKDLQPIDAHHIFKITVYRKSPSRYYTFCTPEARRELEAHLDWRRRLGEQLKDDSPVFRKSFDSPRIQKPVPVTVSSISWNINNLLKQCGLRSFAPLTENQSIPKRTEIMRCHGFRKFFETNAFKAGMNNMYIRRLMGQKSNLEDSYLKLSHSDLLEGDDRHIGYVGIMDSLTIDESQKLRREVETLRVERSSWESLREEVNSLKDLLKQP